MVSTATLTEDLHQALTTNGMTTRRATKVTQLVPPAGQQKLTEALRDDPQNTFPRLAHMFIGDLVELLRTKSWTDAMTCQRAFRTGVVR